MTDDIVKRLREWNRQYSGKMPDDIVSAADLIESLRQQLATREAQIVMLRNELKALSATNKEPK